MLVVARGCLAGGKARGERVALGVPVLGLANCGIPCKFFDACVALIFSSVKWDDTSYRTSVGFKQESLRHVSECNSGAD